MKKFGVLLLLLSVIILNSCSDNPFSSPEESSSPVEVVVYKEGNSINKIDLSTGTSTMIYSATTGTTIGAMTTTQNGTIYIVEYEQTSGGITNIVYRYSPDGRKDLLYKDEETAGYIFSNIYLSPGGKYLLLHTTDSDDMIFLCFDITDGDKVVFTNFGYNRRVIQISVDAVIWDESDKNFYVYSKRSLHGNISHNLTQFDLATATYTSKTSSNYHLYVDRQSLIQQGLFYDSFDFEKYLGPGAETPKYVKFHPDASAFVYMMDSNLRCYNINSGEEKSLLTLPQSYGNGFEFEDICFIWEGGTSPADLTSAIDEEEMYYEITQETLSALVNHNTNIDFTIKNNYKISILNLSWNDNSSDLTYDFVIKGKLYEKKFGAAEFYLVFQTLLEVFYTDVEADLDDIYYGFTTKNDAITRYDAIMTKKNVHLSTLTHSYVSENLSYLHSSLIDIVIPLNILENNILTYLNDNDLANLESTTIALFPTVNPAAIKSYIVQIGADDKANLDILRNLLQYLRNTSSTPAYELKEESLLNLSNLNVFLK